MIFSLTEADRGLNKQYIKEVICSALKIKEGFRKEMRLHLRAKTSQVDKRGKMLKQRTEGRDCSAPTGPCKFFKVEVRGQARYRCDLTSDRDRSQVK